MTEGLPDLPLDPCGCDPAAAAPGPRNAEGLPALAYRVGTHGEFLQRMLRALSRTSPDPDADETASRQARPLANLAARTPDDPSIALLDAAACACDVLTFYQERIADEGFLGTATERRSVLELARAIGYELAPGVAAGTFLAFEVQDAPGAPPQVEIAAGTAVQSVPPQGKLPQIFETSAAVTARAERNVLRPRLTRPAELALYTAPGSPSGGPRLVLVAPAGSFPADTEGLVAAVAAADLFVLNPPLGVPGVVDALPLERVYYDEGASGLQKGDLLLFVGKRLEATSTLVLRIADAVAEPERKRIRVDLEHLPDAVPVVRTPGYRIVPYALRSFGALAAVRLAPIAFSTSNVRSHVVGQTWRERDLRALIGIQGWRPEHVASVANQRPPAPMATTAGAFAFRDRTGFFGHNAPKWRGLFANGAVPPAYPEGWDAGDTSTDLLPRTIWTDSQGNARTAGPHVYLDRSVAGLTRGTWAICTSPEQQPQVFTVADARDASLADYGLSGRATALTLQLEDGGELPSTGRRDFLFRSTTAHVGSRPLPVAEVPIASTVDRTAKSIELDRMVLGLAIGQPIALRGERADAPGVEAAEIAFLADIVHSDGRTTLLLQDSLQHEFVRANLELSANVVAATHGETVHEPLGSGDAAVPNQTFALKKPPLTFVSAATERGRASTLEVRVDGIAWREVASLFEAGPDDQVYAVRIDDDARARVVFGDGRHGARLPTGQANLAATYRSGIGPDGEVAAGSLTILRAMPLGLRGAANPVAASGAAAPERLADARTNAPLTVSTLDRVVSLADLEAYSRTFPGIGKARVDELWVAGGPLVHVTVAGATGGPPGAEVVKKLDAAIRAVGDPALRFAVQAYAQRFFTCTARIVVDPRYLAAEVLAAATARLCSAFGFAARALGQSLLAAELVARVHEVPGVVAVDVDELQLYSGEDPVGSTVSPSALPACSARTADGGALLPAELLLVNPVGIHLLEFAP